MKKIKNKKICIVSDSFVPYPISATGMIYNLCKQFNYQGYEVISIHGAMNTKFQNIDDNYSFENIEIISTKIFSNLRNVNNFMRLFFEISLSIILTVKCMLNYKKFNNLELIVWYGPSSFLWLTVFIIKIISKVKVYYILRDIFPDWLVAVKLIKNKFIIKILETLSFPQYVVPNFIGVETDFNKSYLVKKLINKNYIKKLETLYNWPSLTKKNIKLKKNLVSLKFFDHISKNKYLYFATAVYIGNRSVAHDYYSVQCFLKKNNFSLDLNVFGEVSNLNNETSIGQKFIETFWGYIPELYLPSILEKVDFGLVTLNNDLLTQNIPGKFVTYTQCGVPVICFANKNSSLSHLIKKYDCGLIIDLSDSINYNKYKFNSFLKELKSNRKYYKSNSKKLFNENFNIEVVSKKILKIKDKM